MTNQDKIASKFGIHKSLLEAVRGVVSPKVEEETVEEAAGSRPQDKTGGETNPVDQGSSKEHMCAKQIAHEEYGVGKPIFGQHAEPDRYGNVAWYDVMFDHGVEERLPVTEMKIVATESHMNHKKK